MNKFSKFLITCVLAVSLSFGIGLAANNPSNYNLFPNGVTIDNVPILNTYSGNVWWVDSGTGSDGNQGTFDRSWATIDYAIGRCTANNGDVILVKAGHAENLALADAIDADVAGVHIMGLGSGDDRPTLTYTATAGELVIGAANVTVSNFRFVAGISNVAMGISVETAGDGFSLINCEVPEPGTATYEFADIIDLATGADDVTIDGVLVRQLGVTAGDLDHFLEAGNGVNNRLRVLNSVIEGEFFVSAIWSDTADTEVLIDNCIITNATNGEHAIEFTSTARGSIRNTLVRTDAQGTAVDPGSLTMSNVLWDGDATADSTAIPVVLAGAGVGSIGAVNSTTTDSIHGKIGTDTEMGDVSIWDMLEGAGFVTWPAAAAPGDTVSLAEVLRDIWDAVRNGTGGAEPGTNMSLVDILGNNGTGVTQTGDINAADLQSRIDAISLALGIVAAAAADGYEEDGTGNNLYSALNSTEANGNFFSGDGGAVFDDNLFSFLETLSKYIADGDGDFATGTALAANKSLIDAIGTNGTTVADTATGIAGMIGVNDANNAMDTSTIVPNEDGSVFERLEALEAAADPSYDNPNYIALSVDLTSATWNTQAAHEILTVTGNIRLKVMVECTETLTDAADAATLTLGDEISVAAMIASTSAAGAGAANQLDAGEFWMDNSPADVSPVASSSALLDFVVLQGADVGYTVGGSALLDGTLVFHMWWTPLDATGAAVVGAGGAL